MSRKQYFSPKLTDIKPPVEGSVLDHWPSLRIRLVQGCFALILLAVFSRLLHVQLALAPAYQQQLEPTHKIQRTIRAMRGQILASDNTVLAREITNLTLEMHYRYLESPLNTSWVKQQVRSRLKRLPPEKRPSFTDAVEHFHLELDNLWTRIAERIACPENELRARAEGIQKRIEKIRSTVLKRQQLHIPSTENQNSQDDQGRFTWTSLWKTILNGLRVSEPRMEPDALVIKEETSFHPIYTWPVLSPSPPILEILAEIESNSERYPGIRIRRRILRQYPQQNLASHLVGYLGSVTPRELQQASSLPYQPEDHVGRMGIEASYDHLLRGTPGTTLELLDHRKRRLFQNTKPSTPGHDVVLWLEPKLQRQAEHLLETAVHDTSALSGAMVLLDVRTGGILLAASYPPFNPNDIQNATQKTWKQLVQNPAQPLFDRVTRMAIAPGSVFKVVTAVAALEESRINSQDSFHCQGYLHSPNQLRCLIFARYGQGHGPTTMVDAITRSCNVYFFNCSERLGETRLCQWASRFGFGSRTGVDLPMEASGYLPTPENVKERLGHTWRKGDTPRLAIGQSALLATPLQVARMMAAIANGGKLVRPRLVRRTIPHDANTSLHPQDELAQPSSSMPSNTLPLSSQTQSKLQEGLFRVVNIRGGTAFRTVRSELVEISGKTGTAEIRGGEDHAWFAGYTPSHKPKYAFAVALEHGGSGSANAGPLTLQLIDSMSLDGYFD